MAMILRFFCECTKATLVPLASRLYCGQILTKEGDAYIPLEKRLRTRGRQLVAQCVNFSESGAQ
jgi:hypothetical protein